VVNNKFSPRVVSSVAADFQLDSSADPIDGQTRAAQKHSPKNADDLDVMLAVLRAERRYGDALERRSE
jgi:hypothetical protein